MLETLGIGASLREERIRRGLTLESVESTTRIRRRYLEAIEDERWDELPAEAYAKAFMRTYAAHLELDPQQFLAHFRARRREVEEPIAPQAQVPYEPIRRPWLGAGAAAAAGLALVLAVGAWQLADDGTSTRQTAAAVPTATPAPTTRPAPSAAPKPVRPLLLTGIADSWVEVRRSRATGRLVWSGTLHRGRTLRLGVRRPLWIRLGRPTAVRAAFGRKALVVPDRATVMATAEGLRAV